MKFILITALSALTLSSSALAKDERHQNNNHDEISSQRQWDNSRARNGDGRGYWLENSYYRDGQFVGANCPQGLSRRSNGCLPANFANARWRVGQRLPEAYRNQYVPKQYRDRYTNGTYRYVEGYVYRVAPRTFVIKEVLTAAFR